MSISNYSSSNDSLDDLCKKWELEVSLNKFETPQVDYDDINNSMKFISNKSILNNSSSDLVDSSLIDKKINVFSNQSNTDAQNDLQAQSMSVLKTSKETSKVVNTVLKNDQSTTLLEAPVKPMTQAQKNSEKMMHALGLDVIPDTPEEPDSDSSPLRTHHEKCNQEKKNFVEKHMNLNKTALILSQAKEFPEMHQKLHVLSEHLDLWDDLSLDQNPEGLVELKEELENQIKKVNILCTDLDKMTKQRERMMNALRLNVTPDVPDESEFKTNSFYHHFDPSQLKTHYEKCNQEKKNFVEKHINLNKTALILSQAKGFPEMHQKLHALSEHLELWDDLSLEQNPEAFNELKDELQNQMKNLNILCDDLDKISLQESSDLSPAADTSREKFQKRRKKEAVTTSSIRQQADLHQAIRSSKGWAMQQPQLNTLGTSVNSVYPLNSSETNTPVAFFKVGYGDEAASGTMEKLLWDIAVVMGMEKQFVATGKTQVRTQNELTGGIELTKQWDEKGELKELKSAMPGKKGGIQVAQKGQTLNELKKASELAKVALNVSRDEVVDGTLTSLTLGMFDLHSNNIFVTDEGKIKFFDNTRSLPNSNGFIDRGHDVSSAYRCALLDLDCAKTPLTPDEIDTLKAKIKDYKQKMNQLKKYLASDEIEKQLSTLPPGWMNLSMSLMAMENRIFLMETALNAGQVKTLEDLVTQSNPNYKFAYALTRLELLRQYESVASPPQGIQGSIHGSVGYFPITHTVQIANDLAINLELVEKWCKDPTVNTDELSKRITDHYTQMRSHPLATSEHLEIGKKNLQIWEKINANAAQDYKDVQRDYSVDYTDQKNVKTLCQNGVETLPKERVQTVDSALYYAHSNGLKAVIIGNNASRQVIQNTPIGFRVREFDASFKPGVIREKLQDSAGKTFFGKERSIPDFNISLVNPPTAIDFKELPPLAPGLRNALAMQKGLLISKTPDGTLMLSCRVRNQSGAQAVIHPTFIQNDDGKFFVFTSPWLGVPNNCFCTINELVDLFQKKIDTQLL